MLKHESVHEQDYQLWVVRKETDDRREAALSDQEALYLHKTKMLATLQRLSVSRLCHAGATEITQVNPVNTLSTAPGNKTIFAYTNQLSPSTIRQKHKTVAILESGGPRHLVVESNITVSTFTQVQELSCQLYLRVAYFFRLSIHNIIPKEIAMDYPAVYTVVKSSLAFTRCNLKVMLASIINIQ